jgi:hypothetical protein
MHGAGGLPSTVSRPFARSIRTSRYVYADLLQGVARNLDIVFEALSSRLSPLR